MKYRKCEICNQRAERKNGVKRFFTARFPLNEARCKKWVQVTGNEDLAYIPIQKLNQLKFICGNHFKDKDFHKKRTKLKPTAIPSIQLTRKPLSDNVLSTFPCQLFKEPTECVGNSNISGDHSKNQTVVSDDHAKNQTAVSDHSENQTVLSDHSKNQAAVNINIEDAVDNSQNSAGFDTHSGADDDCYNISDDDCEAVVDDDSSFYHNVSKLSDDKEDMEVEPQNLDKNEDLHDGFKCNFCSGEIKGYRYTCVQCPDYDLCGSCEARGAHCLHYVLRIPRPKPYTEIQPLLREIRLLLSGANTDVLWTPPDEIKEESNDEDDPLDINRVTPTLSETEDNMPEIATGTSVKKSHENRQDNNNDNVPQVTMQPRLTSRLHNATTYTRRKLTVTVDKRSAASTSSPYPASTRLVASNRNTLLISPQAIDNTRTSIFNASTSVSSDGNTVLTIATNVEDTDSTSRSVPTALRLYASSSITPGGTQTTSNKIKITGDSHLQVPMATKRKCSDNIEASKPSQVVLLKGSKKLIVVPSMSKVIGPGTRFKIIKKPSSTGQLQPEAQWTVYAARHRTRSTQREQDAQR